MLEESHHRRYERGEDLRDEPSAIHRRKRNETSTTRTAQGVAGETLSVEPSLSRMVLMVEVLRSECFP